MKSFYRYRLEYIVRSNLFNLASKPILSGLIWIKELQS